MQLEPRRNFKNVCRKEAATSQSVCVPGGRCFAKFERRKFVERPTTGIWTAARTLPEPADNQNRAVSQENAGVISATISTRVVVCRQ